MIRIVMEMQTNDRNDIPAWLKKAILENNFPVETMVRFEESQSFTGFSDG